MNNNNNNMNDLKKEYDNIEVPPEVDLAIEKGIIKGKTYKRKRVLKPLVVIAAGLVLAFGIATGGKFISKSNTSLISLNPIKTLPIVGSSNNLQKLLKTYIGVNNDMAYGSDTGSGPPMTTAMPQLATAMPQLATAEKSTLGSGRNSIAADSKSTINNATSVSLDHSITNLQVQGVDEEDLVKTDGDYIYKVNSQKIINVIKVKSDSNMEAINNITFDDNYNINGIFLRKNVLVVVGNSYENIVPQKGDQNKSFDMMMPSYGITKVISYDISDKKNIVKVREIELDGVYNSSRMIGPIVYIIANKYLNNIGNIAQDANIGTAYYKDSTVGSEKINIDFNKISYLPDSIQPNYITVAAFNVEDNNKKVNVSTILGSGNSIYSSDKNLYIAGTKWTAGKNNNGTTNTILYKFAYENVGVKFEASGAVPGTIINQFSMDESNNHFRIATTEYNYSMVTPMMDAMPSIQDNGATTSIAPVAPDQKSSNQPQNQITNNLYVLDKDMKTVGKLQGLANGEQIYSVRFIGERAYIVTFMLMDPLFVIDLKNPTSPSVLGELKIPGFSNYLHPYDDTHLIGFGMDTTVINEGGMDRARPQGMKIAIFNVSNVAKPVQQFMTTIGGMGTYSEVLNNHKALLFSKEKNLLAMPVTENNYDNKINISEQSYQGAYIYKIDLVNGIVLSGKITHMDEASKTNDNNSITKNNELYPIFNGQYFVDRILYIKDTIYTLSNSLIKASDIDTLKEKSKIKLKTVDYSNEYQKGGVRNVTPPPVP